MFEHDQLSTKPNSTRLGGTTGRGTTSSSVFDIVHENDFTNLSGSELELSPPRFSFTPPDPPPPQTRTESGYNIDEVDACIQSITDWVQLVHQASSSIKIPVKGFEGAFSSITTPKVNLPLDVGVTADFEDSLNRLTDFIAEAFIDDGKNINYMVENVAKIKDLMKTIVLIEDDEDRQRILNYPIIKWVMMCKYSIVGSGSDASNPEDDEEKDIWLMDLMKSGKKPMMKKVIKYFEMVSAVSGSDLIPSKFSSEERFARSSILSNKIHKHEESFKIQRDEIFQTFMELSLFLPSLLLLSDNSMEDVASTPLIRYLIDENLYSTSGSSVIFLDVTSHLFATLTLRRIAYYWVSVLLGKATIQKESDRLTNESIISFTVCVLCMLYWLFRRMNEMMSLFSISIKVYWKYIFTFWNLLDIVTMSLAIFNLTISCLQVVGYVIKDPLLTWLIFNGMTLYSITVGLLWLNLLGTFKVLNQQFATLVLAISRIIRDSFLFLIVLLLVIVAAGDMLTIYLSTNPDACPENLPEYILSLFPETSGEENSSVFCDMAGLSYLAIYNVILGDMDLDDFSASKLTTFVYVVLTFFGIIILLNVLIAIVCDSYATSNKIATRLFGRARLSYVAALIAYKRLIGPVHQRNWNRCRTYISSDLWVHLLARLLVFMVALISMGASSFMAFYVSESFRIEGRFQAWLCIVIAILIALPIFMIWSVLVSYLITGWERSDERYKALRYFQENRLFTLIISRPLVYITHFMLGAREQDRKQDNDIEDLEKKMKDNLLEHNEAMMRSLKLEFNRELAGYKDAFKREFKSYRDHVEMEKQEYLKRAEIKRQEDEKRARLERNEILDLMRKLTSVTELEDGSSRSK